MSYFTSNNLLEVTFSINIESTKIISVDLIEQTYQNKVLELKITVLS